MTTTDEIMILTTLCYIERDGAYLMLHRVKKENDINKDKWIGIGGKFEAGESPEDCLFREVGEETGLELKDFSLRGIVTFLADENAPEYMFLYTADDFEGEPGECSEGTLEWVPKSDIGSLNIWEGDRIFFKLLDSGRPFFSLKLRYTGDRLVEAVLDGKMMELLDVVGPDGEPTGAVRERTMVHESGDRHRTSHVWIVRHAPAGGGYELLLQKRCSTKDSFAGCYDITSAGHIPAGAGYIESALRELYEELGIKAKADELIFVGVHTSRYEGEFYGKPFINDEISNVYILNRAVDISDVTVQESEIEEVKWFDIDEALEAAKNNDPGFCLEADEIEMLRSFLENRRKSAGTQ